MGPHLEKGHPPGRKLKLTRVFTSASRNQSYFLQDGDVRVGVFPEGEFSLWQPHPAEQVLKTRVRA
jgi:hypothetical protein